MMSNTECLRMPSQTVQVQSARQLDIIQRSRPGPNSGCTRNVLVKEVYAVVQACGSDPSP